MGSNFADFRDLTMSLQEVLNFTTMLTLWENSRFAFLKKLYANLTKYMVHKILSRAKLIKPRSNYY